MSVEVISFLRMDSSLAQSSDSDSTSPSRIKLLKAAFEQKTANTPVVTTPKQTPLWKEANNNNNNNNNSNRTSESPKNGLQVKGNVQSERKSLTLDVERARLAENSHNAVSKRITWCGTENASSIDLLATTPIPVPRNKSPKDRSPLPSRSNTTKDASGHGSLSIAVSAPAEVGKPIRPLLNRKVFSVDNSLSPVAKDNRPPRPTTPPLRKAATEEKPPLSVKPAIGKAQSKPTPLLQKGTDVSPVTANRPDGTEWKRTVGPPAKPVPPSPHKSLEQPEKDLRRVPPTPPPGANATRVKAGQDCTVTKSVSSTGSEKRRPPPRPKTTAAEPSKISKPPVPPTLRPKQGVESVLPLQRQKGISKRIDRNQKPMPRQRPSSAADERSLLIQTKDATNGNGRVSPLEAFVTSPQPVSIDDFINSVKRKYRQGVTEDSAKQDQPTADEDNVYDALDDLPAATPTRCQQETVKDTDPFDRVYEPINGGVHINTSDHPEHDSDSGNSLYWTVDDPSADATDEVPPMPPQRQTSLHREKVGRNSITSGCDESDQSSSEDSEYEHPGIVKRGSTLGVFTPEAYMALSEICEEDGGSVQGCYDVEAAQQEATEIDPSSLTEEEDYSDEPLYQLYAADVLNEERKLSQKAGDEESMWSEYSTTSQESGQRILWCQLPSVRGSELLDNLAPEERKRQEAMFEVITSEASYLKSMCVLVNHFMMAPEFIPNTSVAPEDRVLDRQQFHFLFTGVSAVKSISEKLLHDLRSRQEQGVVISSISDIVLEYASKYFACYIKYCSNQIFQDRSLLTIVQENPRFCEVLGRLESSSKCQGLSMQSFMMLPMQRITRMPLLLDAICSHCEPGSEEFHLSDRALRAVNKVVKECNEGARRMERTEQMYFIQQAISFKIKPIPLISTSRWLLRRGQLSCIQDDSKSGGKHRRPLRQLLKGRPKPIYLFLFTDLLLLAKMKSEDNYKVFDYCTRSMLRVEDEVDSANMMANQDDTGGCRSPSVGAAKYVFNLILLENSKGKTVDYLCLAQTETEKTRWLEALSPSQIEPQDGETIYSEWDCPQVQAVHSYHSQQPDELNLQEGDVIKVLRKLADGWFEGQRLRDGEEGWFPANHTEEIISEHVRARNLLQRYRLIHASKVLVNMMQSKQDS